MHYICCTLIKSLLVLKERNENWLQFYSPPVTEISDKDENIA